MNPLKDNSLKDCIMNSHKMSCDFDAYMNRYGFNQVEDQIDEYIAWVDSLTKEEQEAHSKEEEQYRQTHTEKINKKVIKRVVVRKK